MHSIINPKYLHLRDFLLSLPYRFETLQCDAVLHTGRNEVRLYTVAGVRLVVKSFARISWLNRVAYGLLRPSKAVRAYQYAQRLLAMGIDTPVPVAAIDVREGGVLRHSFFVSLYSEYESLDVLNRYPAQPLEPLLDALTDYLLKVHDCGVLHGDLNASNILYRKVDEEYYLFQLIDINRLSFKRNLSHNERLSNLRKLNCNPVAYFYILGRYAQVLNEREEAFQLRGMSMRLMDDMRHRAKMMLKQKIKH